MAVTVLKTSRLAMSEYRTVDGVEFWETPDPIAIPVNEDDGYYVVQGDERLDWIATQVYGNPTLGWVIAFANDLRSPAIELRPGLELRIPSANYVFGVLLRR